MLYFVLLLALLGFSEGKKSSKKSSTASLTTHCYHFPGKDFGKGNCVKDEYGSSPHLMLNAGDDAIDFTLKTREGEEVTLSTLLETKPVVLIWGHYTCPTFQGYLNDEYYKYSSWEYENMMIDKYSDDVHFLHMVGPEPHPLFPYANFDSGLVKMNYWSNYRQPQSYEERLNVSVAKIIPYVSEKATILPDYLDGSGGSYNNPVWCSYSNGARGAFLIGTDNVIQYNQDWFDEPSMSDAIASYLASRRK